MSQCSLNGLVCVISRLIRPGCERGAAAVHRGINVAGRTREAYIGQGAAGSRTREDVDLRTALHAVENRHKNLDDLKQIGFAANRRLLRVERLSHETTIVTETLVALHRPAHIDGQRASTLRCGDPRVQALLAALLRFDLLPAGFRNRELREAVASVRGISFDDYNAGQMTYDLRRLRLRGLIERIPRSQRYRLTAEGLCIALACHRTQARVLSPVLSATLDGKSTTRLHAAVAAYDREVGQLWGGHALAA